MGVISNGKYFTRRLLEWNNTANSRQMPWKGEKDPYKIWLSEIILQQTRVEQGLDYFNRFIEAYPTVYHLAKAPENQVFKLWEGLGYYARCRNLLTAARLIAYQRAGRFPDRIDDIRSLPGVGPYTAAAIGSFAFNLPLAVVDGNVYRVLARFFDIHTPVDTTAGKKEFTSLADSLLDTKQPGIYNQALMDFGATVCKPRRPLCNQCPLQKKCKAYAAGETELLPVKSKSIQKKDRWFYYIVAKYQGKWYVRKRESKDIWQQLYEFIGIETMGPQQTTAPWKLPGLPAFMVKGTPWVSDEYKQQLTHQTVYARFVIVQLSTPIKVPALETVDEFRLQTLPFPKLITMFLQDKNVPLNLMH